MTLFAKTAADHLIDEDDDGEVPARHEPGWKRALPWLGGAAALAGAAYGAHKMGWLPKSTSEVFGGKDKPSEPGIPETAAAMPGFFANTIARGEPNSVTGAATGGAILGAGGSVAKDLYQKFGKPASMEKVRDVLASGTKPAPTSLSANLGLGDLSEPGDIKSHLGGLKGTVLDSTVPVNAKPAKGLGTGEVDPMQVVQRITESASNKGLNPDIQRFGGRGPTLKQVADAIEQQKFNIRDSFITPGKERNVADTLRAMEKGTHPAKLGLGNMVGRGVRTGITGAFVGGGSQYLGNKWFDPESTGKYNVFNRAPVEPPK